MFVKWYRSWKQRHLEEAAITFDVRDGAKQKNKRAYVLTLAILGFSAVLTYFQFYNLKEIERRKEFTEKKRAEKIEAYKDRPL